MSGEHHPTADEVRATLDIGKTKPAGWYAEKFLRPLSMPLIMLCIRMKWSANMVTLIHMIIGVVAGVFVAMGQHHKLFCSYLGLIQPPKTTRQTNLETHVRPSDMLTLNIVPNQNHP